MLWTCPFGKNHHLTMPPRPETSQAQRIDGAFVPVAVTKNRTVHVGGRQIGLDEPTPITEALRHLSSGGKPLATASCSLSVSRRRSLR